MPGGVARRGVDRADGQVIEQNEITAATAHLRATVKVDDHRAIRDAIERVSQATQALAEMIMNSAIQKALKNKRVREVDTDEPTDHLDKH